MSVSVRNSTLASVVGMVLLAAGCQEAAQTDAGQASEEQQNGTLVQIIPGHYMYTSGFQNSGVIATDDGVLVVDGLNSEARGRHVQQLISETIGQPVRYLISSTFHNNFTRGNVAYEDAIKIGHEYHRADLIALMEEDGAPPAEQAGRLTNLTYRDRMTLHLGGKEIQIIHIGPAHTRGDSIVYVPEDRIVYVSELVFYNRFPFYNSGYLGWIDAIDRVLALDADIFVPGQGSMTYDPRESRDGLLAIRQILVDARDGVQAQIAQGATEEEVLQNVTLEQYAHLGGAFEAQSQVMLSRMYRELMGTLE